MALASSHHSDRSVSMITLGSEVPARVVLVRAVLGRVAPSCESEPLDPHAGTKAAAAMTVRITLAAPRTDPSHRPPGSNVNRTLSTGRVPGI